MKYELYRAMPERRSEIKTIVFQQFFDAEGMSTDRVLKRRGSSKSYSEEVKCLRSSAMTG